MAIAAMSRPTPPAETTEVISPMMPLTTPKRVDEKSAARIIHGKDTVQSSWKIEPSASAPSPSRASRTLRGLRRFFRVASTTKPAISTASSGRCPRAMEKTYPIVMVGTVTGGCDIPVTRG
ncbi:hypothetical protein AFR_37460 [Actinoplanes friuliensis DSM 7358]|uniref:Uncharacterized protein n=1 Tax=Actinoplanes friuliensis DSM 7358 TaxID=1246995 RepID=U5WCU1_9ACTN|nr:hypothetical protein AFR_37460 [Actinoplanes friuliensis DSM 7358]